MVTVYSTHCPKCGQLEKKLVSKNIPYEVYDDVQGMIAKGIKGSMPQLGLEDGTVLNFADAWRWISAQEA